MNSVSASLKEGISPKDEKERMVGIRVESAMNSKTTRQENSTFNDFTEDAAREAPENQ